MEDEFLQAATQAPHPIQVAESNASSAFFFEIGILNGGSLEILTLNP